MGYEVYNPRTQHQTPHQYTPAQAAFLVGNVNDRGNQELTDLFNAHFGLNLTLTQIKGYKKNHKLNSGLTGFFPPGQVPFNKGRKGVGGWPPTQFKKGNRPANWVPLGTERISRDGYTEVKIADGRLNKNWKGKHILIWEEHNGPIPCGHVVIFGDGNKRNFDPENLLLVSRAQLIRLNQMKMIQEDAELTKVGIAIADICNKIGERKRTSKEKKGR
ncbi:MAG: HNH endonuclease signature motif containing protein [Eubacteriales bacterium]|jgi:hypothetical protein